AGVLQDGPGYRHPLLLSHRELEAPLADDLVPLVREPLDEIAVRALGCREYVLIAHAEVAETDVVLDRVVEKGYLLRDYPDRFAEDRQSHLLYRRIVDQYRACAREIIAGYELDQGALADAGFSYEGDQLA